MPERVSCRLKTFNKAPGGKIGEYVLDANDSAVLHMELAGGAVGVLHASRMASGHLNDLTARVFGTRGGIEVWGDGRGSRLRASVGEDMKTGVWKDIPFQPVDTNYQRFVAAIRGDKPVDPDFARGAALQKVLDLAVVSDRHGAADLKV
jgi:predicted dehydrogenase